MLIYIILLNSEQFELLVVAFCLIQITEGNNVVNKYPKNSIVFKTMNWDELGQPRWMDIFLFVVVFIRTFQGGCIGAMLCLVKIHIYMNLGAWLHCC